MGFALLVTCLPATAIGQRYIYANQYDALGRLTQTTLPGGAATGYEWNEAGQLLAQTDALGRRTAYAYDAAGRRISRSLANGGQEGSAWNAEGQLISQTHLDGSQSTYSYQQGRLIGQTRADGHLAIGHDRHGRANHYSDSQRGLLTLALDPLGRQASETTARGPTRSQTQTQWDAASQRSQLSAHFENHSPHTMFEKYFLSRKSGYSITYDDPEKTLEEKRERLASNDYFDFIIEGDIKIFLSIGRKSVSFDFYDKDYLWGAEGFGFDAFVRARKFVFDLFPDLVVLMSPTSGQYPASWVYELSLEGLSVDAIVSRIGREWVVFDPPADFDFNENIDKVYHLSTTWAQNL